MDIHIDIALVLLIAKPNGGRHLIILKMSFKKLRIKGL